MSTQGTTPAGRPAADTVGGWVVFAGLVLIIAGFLDAFWGLAGVINDEVLRVGGRGVIVLDFTAWGWAHLILGSLMVLTGFGLFAGSGWARWTAVLFASLNAILQIGVITAFPLWSLLLVALDITVIYQLTAKWSENVAGLRM
jgi:hypothetical protein